MDELEARKVEALERIADALETLIDGRGKASARSGGTGNGPPGSGGG